MTGRKIAFIFGAAFAVLLAANAVFIWFAVSSSPGLVTQSPFERGKSYNRELAAAAAQDALGWRAALDWAEGAAVLRIAARDGRPVEGLDAVLVVSRPVEADTPREIRLVEAAPGRYEAALPLPRAGQWQLDLAAIRGAEAISLSKRIVVR